MGYSYVSSRPEHPKATLMPEEPLKKLCTQIRQLLADNLGKRLELWFQDEARFGQQGMLSQQWAPKGTRPTGWRQTKYESLYVFGAACPQTGQSVGLLAPYLNTDSVNDFFRQFEKEADPYVHVFMIWDQAGFHTSSNVEVPDNVTVIPLPPYSPQLNPVEKLWQYLRKHHW